MRFKERAWTRVDWALAAMCALLVYGIMYRASDHTVYVFPPSLWLAGAWAHPLLAVIVALPVGLRRRDPMGALLLALVSCSLIVAAGGEINRGPFLPLALVLFTVAATRTRTVAVAALAASLALLVVQGFILSMTGNGSGPFPMRGGMNRLLKDVQVTFRRDAETLRPRINREGSVLDREQRERGEFYYEAAA